MKRNSSIRYKLIAAIFIGCLIPYIIGGLYLKSSIDDWLYRDGIESTNQILYRVSDLIDQAMVSHIKEDLELLTSIDSMKDAASNLQNYTKYEKTTFQYQPSDTEEAIEEHLRLLKISHNAVNFVFVGTEDGGYMEYPRFQPQKQYDPRLRPWYQYTIFKDEIRVSEPYYTAMSNEMVISFTKQVKDKDNETIGVIGISVRLYDLMTSINNIKIGKSGYLLLMSPNHTFLLSPQHPEWIMKTPYELGLNEFKAIGREKETVFEAKIDNANKVLNVVTSEETGWHIISVIEKDEILQKARTVTHILVIIYAITFALIFLIVLQITKRFAKPVLEIAAVINRMNDFDFKISTDIESHAKRKDEIGIVSTALVEMHDNYTEFINQVQYIDEEIRNINIENNDLLKVQVSKNSPFHGVVDSMNNLLAKNHQYFKYINFLALHDPLTKLPNRRQFIDLLTDKLAAGEKGAVIMLDLDDFKGINDTLGHVFGDRVIQTIAERLAEIADEHTMVSRFGGDEFLILVERNDAPAELGLLIRKIQSVCESIINIDNNDIEIRFSMGISLFPEDGTDVNQLIMNADLAMYSVKDSGKNGHRFFNSGMMNTQINKSKIEFLLRDAIENDGFDIVYQPQVHLKDGEIYGYEALLRLKDADIPPSEFIPIAEINGSITRIGRIVTEKVIRQLAEWKESGLKLKPVSINFSANQLHDSGYLGFIEGRLKEYDIEPQYLEIEITEGIFLESKQAAMVFLMRLKKKGIAISIDDFGTGYSSLNYMTSLPADKIKLDRSLNNRILSMESNKVMASLISLVHSLGLTVIAEGIENREHVERLKEAECDFIQGFYYSKPLPPEKIYEIHNNRYVE